MVYTDFEKDPKTAYENFTGMFENVTTPISKARASFWLESQQNFRDNISLNVVCKSGSLSFNFRGQLAIKKNSKDFFLPDFKDLTKEDLDKFKKNSLVQAIVILNQANHSKLLKSFTRKLINDMETTKDTVILIKLLNQINKTSPAFVTVRLFIGISTFLI